ncbi:HELT protein, partial [Rhinopomastus cyanomelas]|nr:HELT protein [Rhinopomastus cyanomelas]
RTPVSHKVIEKRRRDRINRCLTELGKTVPMALAKQVGVGAPLSPSPRCAATPVPLRQAGSCTAGQLQRRGADVPVSPDPQQSSGKLEKAEILEMTVQYLRALHSADFPRGREKAELLSEFANYFHYGYHECMKNLVHYLTTVERMETKDTKYARILAFLQSKARFVTEPLFASLGSLPEPDFSYRPHPGPECPAEVGLQPPSGSPFPWHGSGRSPPLPYTLPSAAAPLGSPGPQRSTFLSSVQGLDRRYLSLLGHSHPNAFGLPPGQHPSAL